MSYPYTEKGLAKALKEEFDSDSPVISETFHNISTEGELGGNIEGTYEFKTEDGNKYQISTEGDQVLVPHSLPINRMFRITSIKKI